MKRIYVIGQDGNPLRDFLLQWSISYSQSAPVTLLLNGTKQVFPIGEGDEQFLAMEKLIVTYCPEYLGESNRVLITNSPMLDADLVLVFIEQHINAWGTVSELLSSAGGAMDGRVFWDFQTSRFDERYWRKGICVESLTKNKPQDFEFILNTRDRTQWLKAQIFNRLEINYLSKNHRKQLRALVQWAETVLAQGGA